MRRAHLGLFVCEAGLLTIKAVGEIYEQTLEANYCDSGSKSAFDFYVAAEKVKLAGEILSNFIWFSIIGTMVWMYKRYLAPMSVEEKKSLSRKLVSIFNLSGSQRAGAEEVSETDSAANDLVR